MNHTPKIIAVILAGGIGKRMCLDYPKQFSKIAGKTILEHTITLFQRHECIDKIIVVAEPNYYTHIEQLISVNNFSKVDKIVFGGKERSDSTFSAIQSLAKEHQDSKIIIHDAVRPLLTTDIITNCIKKLDQYNAVDVVIPATDTIVHVNNDKQEIIDIPKRAEYYQGQTPQAFKLGVLRKAYDIYQNNNIQGTCDCSIVLKTLPNEKIAILEGSETNIKLTRPVDLFIADKLFQSRSHFSLKNIQSTHALSYLENKVIIVIGGSYGIGKDIMDFAKKIGAKTYSLSRSTGVNVIDIDGLSQAFKNIYQKEGRIDYVINTAAILVHKSLHSMIYTEITDSIHINYIGTVNSALIAYPYLKETKGGFLSFTSSSYTRGRPFYSIYSSTKAAIANLSQALAEEWLTDGITINCINPERTKTPMRTNAFGVEPQGTLLNSKTVAFSALLVLCSQETGNIIDVSLQDENHIRHFIDEFEQEK